MTDTPLVSVVIAVHNGLPYLEATLRSVMAQSLREIEIIVVDDASSDGTPEVLARLAAEDPRLRAERLEVNAGTSAAANRGLDLARAPLVARMDADDLCAPERLAVQKAYLDAHPGVVLCGTSIREIAADDRVLKERRFPRDAVATRWLARFHMPFTHPSIMLRQPAPGGQSLRYDPAFVAPDNPRRALSEDYDFCSRAMDLGDTVVLGDVLVSYRRHAASQSAGRGARKQTRGPEVAARNMARDLPPDLAADLLPFLDLQYDRTRATPAAMSRTTAAFARMLKADARAHPDHAAWFRRQAAALLFAAFRRGGARPLTIARVFATQAPMLLGARLMRYLEVHGPLPRALRADPQV